ncbi:hypothetical protein [Chitinilyticum piscinae]|uniref:Uncharacterized protein n=1 Tax=Chitinilyticum piscinae TaxID=2866724 RepID=A0A8J7FUV0_9NEIS|nr:hypothetical protein [Chitinilyticum piscinae]MBE9611031.1 hypothetical protein [Chitinilyticum piscinae]
MEVESVSLQDISFRQLADWNVIPGAEASDHKGRLVVFVGNPTDVGFIAKSLYTYIADSKEKDLCIRKIIIVVLIAKTKWDAAWRPYAESVSAKIDESIISTFYG